MKKKYLLLLSILVLAVTSIPSEAQNKLTVRYFNQIRWEGQLTYNFFTGPDAGNFRTSINGFGSGILDLFGMRTSSDIINIGSEKYYLSIGAGFAVTKYRLADNLVFLGPQSSIAFSMPDPNPTHDYGSGFFSYGKSKIITTSLYFPVDLNLAIGKNILFTAGGYLDLNATARYKMKYLVGEDKVKEIIRSEEFRKLNPSTVKFGVNATFFHKKLGYGLSASWSLTPFFKPGWGPDIHEARISASYRIRNLKEMFKKTE
ncbi:MAG: hypothetical protein WC699_04575 [Bacteroidales bacterium]|jgi:hypothetical protein